MLTLFLIVLLAYLAAFLGAQHRKDRRALESWWVAALAVAFASSSVVVYTVFFAESRSAGGQVAWIGVSAQRPGDSLSIGGSRQKATVGWPNGAFSPALTFSEAAPGKVRVQVQGGGGFVRGPGGFLNGVELPEKQATPAGDFTIEAGALPWRLCLACRVPIRILNSAGVQVAGIEPRAGGDARVSALYASLTADIARLRKTDAGAAAALESWSSNRRLLVSRRGLRLLSSDETPPPTEVALPATLTAYWPGQSLPVELRESADGRIEAGFLPPWRLSSPLPPPAPETEPHLTVEAAATPGDFAMLLPLGADLQNLSATLALTGPRFTNADRGAHLQFAKVLSQKTVRTDKLDLEFASIQDQPSWVRVLLALVIALAIFGVGLWVARPRLGWRDGWVLGGIACSIWVILSIRVMLAFRYSLDPAHFDQFAFDGVASALRALCAVPALILLAARLRRDRAAQTQFHSPVERSEAGRSVVLFMLLAGLGCLADTWLAHSLWPNESERYAGGLGRIGLSSLFTTGFLLVAMLWVCGYVYFLYFFDPEREMSEQLRSLFDRWRSLLHRRIVESFALEQTSGFWRHLGSTLDEDDEYEQNDYATRLKILMSVLGALVAAAVLVGAVTNFAGANQKFLQEVAAPFLLCWMPACVWLGARLHFRPGGRMSRRDLAWLVPWLLASILLLLAPVVLFPVLLGDAGGIVAAFSFFAPAIALLWAGGKPRRLQWMPMGVLLFALAAAGIVYLNVDYVTRLPGEARVRLLIFKEGANLQERLPGLPMLKEDAANAPTVRQVSQGLQHTWENKAMAHEGGWLGLGYGHAPVRRSQVPQHTLQVDSTYSFFIASEFGLLGGASLLLIYAMPLVWVLIGARPRFDLGHGLAMLIASAFLLEAIIHAGMNLTAFPYTGRDLPLLAVSSFTDLMRWTLLFSIAVRALQWRALGGEEGVEGYRTESIISPPAHPGAAESVREPLNHYRHAVLAASLLPAVLFCWTLFRGAQIVFDAGLGEPFQWTRLLASIRQAADQGKLRVNPKTLEIEVADASLAQQGGTLIEQEIARFNSLSQSEKLEGLGKHAAEFRARLRQVRTLPDYDRLLDWLRSVDEEDGSREQRPQLFRLIADPRTLDEDGKVPVAERGYQILPNPAFNTSVSFHEASKQDIPSVSLRGQASGMYVIRGRNFEFRIPNLPAKVSDDQVVWLDERTDGSLRKTTEVSETPDAKIWVHYKPEKKARPSFELGDLRVTAGGLMFRPVIEARLYRPGSPLSKKLPKNVLEKLAPGDRVEAAYPVGIHKIKPAFTVERSAQGALIGPAWVMGNWIATYDPSVPIPWTESLAAALPDEQVRLKGDLAKRFGALTLDKTLQASLENFASDVGREHYTEYLRTGAAGRDPLPPRVAIAVVSLPRGEVLGLGGWPRMNASRHWENAGAGAIPPFTWVDREAPHSLRIRYQSDRNFDRIAVGSASKPLWASAVLSLHPGLDKKLETQGDDETENNVFGIEIPGRGWAVHPSGWRGLAEYLAVSDNRYQVRLGFLGLARSEPEHPADMAPGDSSPSQKESLDGGSAAWGHYPVFDEIDFQPSRPTRMHGLEQTKLAERLKALYGIGIETGEIAHRRSFWTGDEQDDWSPAGKAPLSSALEYTSPEAPDFEFNRVEDPRHYITLLLGGGTNLWSNVDFAGAFATCVLGTPVEPHVTRLDAASIKPAKDRMAGFDGPAAFYKGLSDVIDSPNGTARAFLQSKGLAVLANMKGVQHYAKTGTLGSDEGSGNVSRIVLVLVRGDRKHVQAGLVISVVVEHAKQGTATGYLGDFLVKNEAGLRRMLGLP